MGVMLYEQLVEINRRPAPFEQYTAEALWTDAHISAQMLTYHLNPENDRASYRLPFIETAVAWLQARFQIADGTRVADFGCGPGLYATRLAALGAEVTGIDFSRRSLQYARESAAAQGLAVDWVAGNYLTFSSEKQFDLILLISCDFCALNPEQRGDLLQIFGRQLAPSGAVVLDVQSLAAFEQRQEGATYGHLPDGGFWAAEPYYAFTNTFKYEAEKVTLDKHTIISSRREFVIYNWLQHYDRDTLAHEFSANGLAAEAWHANVAGAPYEEDGPVTAVVARRA